MRNLLQPFDLGLASTHSSEYNLALIFVSAQGKLTAGAMPISDVQGESRLSCKYIGICTGWSHHCWQDLWKCRGIWCKDRRARLLLCILVVGLVDGELSEAWLRYSAMAQAQCLTHETQVCRHQIAPYECTVLFIHTPVCSPGKLHCSKIIGLGIVSPASASRLTWKLSSLTWYVCSCWKGSQRKITNIAQLNPCTGVGGEGLHVCGRKFIP